MKINEMKIVKTQQNKVYMYRKSNKNFYFYVGELRGKMICKVRRIKLEEFLENIEYYYKLWLYI